MPPPRRLIAVILLLAGGCVTSPFDPAFDHAARGPVDAAQPIVGAWAGRWTTEDGNASGPARILVTASGTGTESGTRTDKFAMELGGFPQAEFGQQFAAEAVVDPRGGPVRDFAAKVPSVVVEGGAVAVAVGLQAHVDGDRLHVDYWVNDALQQLDAGHIDLQRARPAGGRGAADDAE